MESRQVPLLIRFVYFLVVGWWLGGALAGVGWLLCVLVLTLPLGLFVLHKVPLLTTLQLPDEQLLALGERTDTFIIRRRPEPYPFVARAIWFVLVGWWLSVLWISVAYALSATFVLSPIGFWMFNRVPLVLTLEGAS